MSLIDGREIARAVVFARLRQIGVGMVVALLVGAVVWALSGCEDDAEKCKYRERCLAYSAAEFEAKCAELRPIDECKADSLKMTWAYCEHRYPRYPHCPKDHANAVVWGQQ